MNLNSCSKRTQQANLAFRKINKLNELISHIKRSNKFPFLFLSSYPYLYIFYKLNLKRTIQV